MTVQNPLYLQTKLYKAKQDRQALGDFVGEGVLLYTSLAPSSSGATRGMSISSGAAYVLGDTNANQGMYRVFNDAAVTVTHAAAVTNPRLDQIICRVYDSTEVGSGPDQATIEILQGTETSGATLINRNGAASLPATAILLADVLIGTGSGVLSGSDFTDRRSCCSPIQGLVDGATSSTHGASRLIQGAGWTAARSTAGLYTVTFTTPFAAAPWVDATAAFQDTYAAVDSVTTGSFRVKIDDSSGTGQDVNFYFEAKPFQF